MTDITGRPRKRLVNPDDPILINFLELFGLKSWDDHKTWTQQDLIDNSSVQKYFSSRNQLLHLSFPLNDVRKIKIDSPQNFKEKDLITLLGQIAKFYGYMLISYTKDIKPTKTNGLAKKKCYQVYGLTKLPVLDSSQSSSKN